TVILADGSVHHFNSKQNTLKQLASGDLILNKDTINENSDKTESKGLNQLLIPYGKRMKITLSDGTHIWLNSGSKLLYPPHFSGRTREVYLTGEAYFDVAKNPKNPFHVNTPNVKVIVTGTKFDVSSYNDDKVTRTVLAEGRVTVKKNQLFAKGVNLVPGEGAFYNKDQKDLNKGKADVSLSTSWVYGYLIFHGEPMSEVLKKISRYYNKTIIPGSDVQSISFSGKLDLKDNIDVVLQDVAFASTLQVTNKNDKYYVKK
ncbi:MAG: FecR domain-containing protein, partial [Bacteroidota bacterium]|nr:FecR domain-containing protein [Bacteroidota bacterium]